MNTELEFVQFPKMARLSREIIITEKIDGTNAQIYITEDGEIYAGSRTRWITPEDDNYGFAKWVHENRDDLINLGPGRHFGEWWGNGIQRNYGLPKGDKRLSLFNVTRWTLHGTEPKLISSPYAEEEKYQDVLPKCVGLVPIIYKGDFDIYIVNVALESLKNSGSFAVSGFINPEGIVVFHTAANVGFKKTIEKDEVPKSKYQKA